MAILQVFAVRDSALDAFQRPFFVPAQGLAIRAFSDEVNNPQSDFFKHPADYELFHLGSYEEDTAGFQLLPQPKSVIRAKDSIIPADTPKSVSRVK